MQPRRITTIEYLQSKLNIIWNILIWVKLGLLYILFKAVYKFRTWAFSQDPPVEIPQFSDLYIFLAACVINLVSRQMIYKIIHNFVKNRLVEKNPNLFIYKLKATKKLLIDSLWYIIISVRFFVF